MRLHPKRLLSPALLLSLLGLAMTIEAMIRLRPYVHGRYYSNAAWQLDPVSCVASYLGLACIALGAWLWLSENGPGDGDDQPGQQ